MFIVVAKHPYYPEVYNCETMEEAKRIRQECIDLIAANDGCYELTIYIAEVISVDNLKSNY